MHYSHQDTEDVVVVNMITACEPAATGSVV